jgi:hypothetical protein
MMVDFAVGIVDSGWETVKGDPRSVHAHAAAANCHVDPVIVLADWARSRLQIVANCRRDESVEISMM